MTTTVAEAIRHAIERGLARVHLSVGTDLSKSRWGPQVQQYATACSVRPRWSSRAALRLFAWSRDNARMAGALDRLLPARRFE